MKKLLAIVLTFTSLLCICGCSTEFNKCDHSWVPATCIRLEKCSKCGQTNGGFAKHTTKLGKCNNCGKIINEYPGIIDSISSNLNLSLEAACDSGEVIIYNSAFINDSVINESKEYINLSKRYLNLAIVSCEDIQELKTEKNYLNEAKNALDKITGTGQTYLDNYTLQSKVYNQYVEKVNNALLSWLS